MALNPTPITSQVQSDSSIAPFRLANGSDAVLPEIDINQGGGTNANQAAADRLAANRSIFTLEATDLMPKYWFMITVMDFQGYSGFGGSPGSVQVAGTPLGHIRLPIPRGLDDVQDVQYTETPMGPALGGAYNAYQSGAGADGITEATTLGWAVNNPDSAAIAAGTALGGLFGGTGAVVGGAIGAAVPAGSLVQGAGAAFGIAVNQFYTILLQGPKYKSYTLSFDLAPRTAQESTNIRDIITILRRTAAPEITGPFGMFWEFPDIVECNFMPQNTAGIDTYMYRFKPAVLTSVAARYNPNQSVGFYAGTGAPEAITLTLSFTELEYWLRPDFA